MLDVRTRQRIDTARDILVGKVPDPKSQVEQITLALMYKFMGDMDAQSEEYGGKATFFAGDFARYSWRKIVGRGIGAYDALNLYSEGMTRMGENPGLPALFRSMFNNAYLPFRDPETLKGFLQVIDEFEYDNSERLGDAFEYLLSIMGSQGDAGQFRTPRHIIDFIVEIVDPKKDERILDPACGTAGFLISAYKHIGKTNEDVETPLTSAERTRLAENVRGYDISPDMVRLSLVNLYLHGFPEPDIFEYDTLTSEERWGEYANVILANPPFMSPKGGIRPHNRFSVTSKRSEVLFVDYIAEHLTPDGRAGVIVPEGIIFQSQNAHTQLRKMLVNEYLVAVVSLPPGVFNPYSGVKTSILLLDKALARRADTIGFFKVENDGFDLGAQRRPVDRNDLPRVKAEVSEYLRRMREGDGVDEYAPENGLVVEKERIGADGEFNLGGERYRVSALTSSEYPIVKLGEVAEIIAGQSPPGTSYNSASEGAPFYQGKTEFGNRYIGEAVKWTTDPRRFAEPTDILMSVRAPVGPINLTNQRICIGRGLSAIRPNSDRLQKLFLFHILRSLESQISGNTGTAFASINVRDIKKIEFPLPPSAVQREIVSEIEGNQRVIDGARAVVDNWRPRIAVDPEWPVVAVKEVCTLNPKKSELNNIDPSTRVSFVPMADVREYTMHVQPSQERTISDVKASYSYFRDDDVLIARVTPCFENGKAGIATGLKNGVGFGSSEFHVFRCHESISPSWLYLSLMEPKFKDAAIRNMTGTGGLQRVPRRFVEEYQIAVPTLDTQSRILAEIAEDAASVESNVALMQRLGRRIAKTIERVWQAE